MAYFKPTVCALTLFTQGNLSRFFNLACGRWKYPIGSALTTYALTPNQLLNHVVWHTSSPLFVLLHYSHRFLHSTKLLTLY